MSKKYFIFLVIIFAAVACQPEANNTSVIRVDLRIDSELEVFDYYEFVTVEDVLEDQNIVLNDSDRINPGLSTVIRNGMQITIVRVRVEEACVIEEIAFEQRVVPGEGLEVGEEQVSQVGQPGEQEICYRTTIENGIANDRIVIGEPTILKESIDEILLIGSDEAVPSVQIVGTLAYINDGDAWIITDETNAKKQLTDNNDLDSLVFQLSDDARQLVFTRQAANESEFLNDLWLVFTDGRDDPVQLAPTNVLLADWVPGQVNALSYSTGQKVTSEPFWQALNNLSLIQIDLETGQTLRIQEIIPESSGGLYGWWGTVFEWSPDGTQLAWIRADSLGLVNLDTGALNPIARFSEFNVSQPWSWRSTVSWSGDAALIATNIHGLPLGSEPPENSPVFDVTIMDTTGERVVTLVEGAGIWATPKYAPTSTDVPDGQLAYLKARQPFSSVSGEYDLIVADRDGSNAEIVFPTEGGMSGITANRFGLTVDNYTWSPDGHQIALIYRGDLWIVDILSRIANQITFDGSTSRVAWVG